MSLKLDRSGIFMAKAVSWMIRSYESGADAINIEFQILGQLQQDDTWEDWRQYEEHTVYGQFFFTKKDGTVNTTTVAQLAKSLGWSGDLYEVNDGPPPSRSVQITVEAEEYKGNVYYKAKWINPKDYKPQPQGASPQQVQQLQGRFGSLLRAAAAAAVANQPAPAPETTKTAPAVSDDDLPF